MWGGVTIGKPVINSLKRYDERGCAGPVCHNDWRCSPVQFDGLREKTPRCECISRWSDRRVQQMTRFWVDRHKQCELLTTLYDCRLVQQDYCRQIGGHQPARTTAGRISEPYPNCDMGSFDRDPPKHTLDLAQIHTAVVKQDRRLDELAIRWSRLKNSTSPST